MKQETATSQNEITDDDLEEVNAFAVDGDLIAEEDFNLDDYEVTAYRVVCDECYDQSELIANTYEIEELNDWYKLNGKVYCRECYEEITGGGE